MIRQLVILSVTMVALASCSSNKKKDEAPVETPAAEVTNKDMSSNPAGSDSGTIDGLVTVHFDYDKATLSGEAKKSCKETRSG